MPNRMKPKSHPVFCPRCDRKFDSNQTRKASMAILTSHVKKAHPEMYDEFTDED